MKINHVRFVLPMLACVLALLLVLVCVPVKVHAQTRYVPYQYQPQGTVTSLQRSIRFRGNYVFSPTYVTCRVYRPCVTVVNRTGNVVMLVNGYGRFVTKLWPGGSFNLAYYYPGTFYVTDVQYNIRVPLTVTVLGGYAGDTRGYEPTRPMPWTWRRF